MFIMEVACAAAAMSPAALAMSDSRVVYVIALTACGFTMGLIYAVTTVATQAVVWPDRAGEAAGVALTSLVTLAGVGVAVSRGATARGMSTGSGTGATVPAIAAALLPAAVAVLTFRRS